MNDLFTRTEFLIGQINFNKLVSSCVAVFGIGGVGSFAVEALARSGIGRIIIVDHDIIVPSNINRQLIATLSTIDSPKVFSMEKRILDINPSCHVVSHQEFCNQNNIKDFIPDDCDYIIDAIDSVSSKLDLISFANKMNVPIISCMGAGNKLDPTMFEISDIYETSVCPLCRVMRNKLKKMNVKSLKVVYSKEKPIKPYFKDLPPYQNSNIYSLDSTEKSHSKVIGSISFVPSVAGLIAAGQVIKDIINFSC